MRVSAVGGVTALSATIPERCEWYKHSAALHFVAVSGAVAMPAETGASGGGLPTGAITYCPSCPLGRNGMATMLGRGYQ